MKIDGKRSFSVACFACSVFPVGSVLPIALLPIASLLLASTAWGQRNLRDVPPPDPQIELASFRVPEGFEVNLWASDPLLAKPTQITFDKQGRLWASSSETYPQLNVNQEPTDRIVILEDTNADGVADKSAVYYDKLLIPGGVLPDGKGGAYVAHAKELLHLHDTDGDGVADREEVLLSGFGTEDTHHTLHRLQWGPGGLMYMLQGYYIGTHVETLYGPRRLNGGGLWSFDTSSRRLEIFSRGLVNPWGMRFDRWGQTFQTDGAGGEGINYSFPDSVFRASPLENRFLRGLNPKRPKLCGLEIVSGSHFPDAWQGRVVAADFRANNIDSYVLEEDGSGFASTLADDMLQSTHVSFRPIDMVMGPDGALYIADWYSPIIQHGEVDFRDERRDHVHGRIWRISAKDRPLDPPVDYGKATESQLLEHLKSASDSVRLNVRQELKLRPQQVVASAIEAWLPQLDPDDADYDRLRLEAFWTYQTIGLKPAAFELASELLKSGDHRVRAATVRCFYRWPDAQTPDAVIETIKPLVADEHPRVRREAVTALGQFSSVAAASVALGALDHPMDTYLDFALWRTCRLLEPQWLPAFLGGELNFESNASRMAFALKAVEKQEALGPLVELLKQDSQNGDPAIVRLIGKLGTAEQLETVLSIAAQDGHPLRADAVASLVEAGLDRGIKPGSDELRSQLCERLLSGEDSSMVANACRIIGFWKPTGSSAFEASLVAYLDEVSDELRSAAAMGLVDLGSASRLAEAATRSATTPGRVTASAALVRVSVDEGVDAVIQMMVNERSESQVEELMDAILTQRGALAAFTSRIAKQKIDRQNAIYVTRLIETSSAGRDRDVLQAVARSGGLNVTGTNQESPADTAGLLARVKDGNAERGAKIFRREKLTCVKCHAVGGEGPSIGPDLSSIGAAAPVDYLIESLLHPSKKIKEGYRMSIIVTEDGDVYSGTVVREDTNVVIVRNAAGKETRIARSQIESRETGAASMMPSGLTNSLSEEEFADLIAYLASLGRQK